MTKQTVPPAQPELLHRDGPHEYSERAYKVVEASKQIAGGRVAGAYTWLHKRECNQDRQRRGHSIGLRGPFNTHIILQEKSMRCGQSLQKRCMPGVGRSKREILALRWSLPSNRPIFYWTDNGATHRRPMNSTVKKKN